MDTPINLASSPGRPCLLPAFEPRSPSSSPSMEAGKRTAAIGPFGGHERRTLKRTFAERDDTAAAAAAAHHGSDRTAYYPTPVPTSSTGMLPSSPSARRPGLIRSVSALSERAPLGAVPSLEVPGNGEPVLMGRSSNSSDYQLSANRLISRVHVKARYLKDEGEGLDEQSQESRIQVECLGWNGCKIHLLGKVVELAKGEKWCSTKIGAQILVDVQDTRVLLTWPRITTSASSADVSRAGSESPSKRRRLEKDVLPSSPPLMPSPFLRSPVSVAAGDLGTTSFAATFIAGSTLGLPQTQPGDVVKVFEDRGSLENARDVTPTPASALSAKHAPNLLEEESSNSLPSSILSEPEELSEHDEENDPIVHSFGPYGENILAKFASIQSIASPLQYPKVDNAGLGIAMTLEAGKKTSPKRKFRESPIKNHVINQLAYSRVHSIPLSTIFSNVPNDMRRAGPRQESSQTPPSPMKHSELRALLLGIPCVGQISREGKDAAGKALEDEYYYLPDLDDDEIRRDSVGVARPPLRNVRKQHKQYYWKKPR